MNHPKVYDAKGRVLEVGSRVERCLPNGSRGGIPGGILWLTKLDVLVEWPGRRAFYKPERHSMLRRGYRCPDLLLITDDEKGDPVPRQIEHEAQVECEGDGQLLIHQMPGGEPEYGPCPGCSNCEPNRSSTQSTEVPAFERIARAFHDEYEAWAKANGWETQEATRTGFDDLPAENRETMLATVRSLLDRKIIFLPSETQVQSASSKEVGGDGE